MELCVKLIDDKDRSLVQHAKNPWNQSEELLCAVGLLAQLNLTGLVHPMFEVDHSYKRGVADGTSQILFHMIPFMLYLIVFARLLVGFISAGRFSPDEIGTTTQYLQALSVSLPLYGVNTYLQKVCSSMRRMSLYARAHVIAALIQTALCLLLTPILGLKL